MIEFHINHGKLLANLEKRENRRKVAKGKVEPNGSLRLSLTANAISFVCVIRQISAHLRIASIFMPVRCPLQKEWHVVRNTQRCSTETHHTDSIHQQRVQAHHPKEVSHCRTLQIRRFHHSRRLNHHYGVLHHHPLFQEFRPYRTPHQCRRFHFHLRKTLHAGIRTLQTLNNWLLSLRRRIRRLFNYIPGEARHKVLTVAQSFPEVLQKAKQFLQADVPTKVWPILFSK